MKNNWLKRIINCICDKMLIIILISTYALIMAIIFDATKDVDIGGFISSKLNLGETYTYEDTTEEDYIDQLYEEMIENEELTRREKLAQEYIEDKMYQEMVEEYGVFDDEHIVYIAPYSGERYHFNRNCKGLESAKSVEEIKRQDARDEGYTLCGFED
jgi:hypothetical protein